MELERAQAKNEAEHLRAEIRRFADAPCRREGESRIY